MKCQYCGGTSCPTFGCFDMIPEKTFYRVVVNNKQAYIDFPTIKAATDYAEHAKEKGFFKRLEAVQAWPKNKHIRRIRLLSLNEIL